MNKTSRRSFLQSSTLALGGLTLLPTLSFAKPCTQEKLHPVLKANVKAKKRVVILQDRAHFDETGIFETYIPPKSMTATREYTNNLDAETFISRHWFV